MRFLLLAAILFAAGCGAADGATTAPATKPAARAEAPAARRPAPESSNNEKPAEAAAERPRPIVRVLNADAPGGRIELEPALVRGRVNIVDFYSDYCGPCVALSPRLSALAKKRPDAIAVLKVNVNRPGVEGIDWESPVARQFDLTTLPHLVVTDRTGRVQAVGERAYFMVEGMLLAEGIE